MKEKTIIIEEWVEQPLGRTRSIFFRLRWDLIGFWFTYLSFALWFGWVVWQWVAK